MYIKGHKSLLGKNSHPASTGISKLTLRYGLIKTKCRVLTEKAYTTKVFHLFKKSLIGNFHTYFFNNIFKPVVIHTYTCH